MASESPQSSNASDNQYFSGLQTGCLLGCSPLICLVLVVILSSTSYFGRSKREEESTTIPLPPIDSTAPIARLLPEKPEEVRSPLYLGDDLSCVPELMLEAAPKGTTNEWKSRKAHAVAAALKLNRNEEDGYLKAVLSARSDLAGLPFVMGNSCRTTGKRAKEFKEAAESVNSRKGAALLIEAPQLKEGIEKLDRFYQAHLVVIAQVAPVSDLAGHHSFIRGVSSIPRPEATQALARLALFSPDEAVRSAAIEALSFRREVDATEVLIAGLRYPWPPVANNAADAIARLKRKDLIPQLEKVLQESDPRGPRTEEVDGQKKVVAHELVRVNHLRNCLLCHAPAERSGTNEDTLVAEIPVPSMSLPDTSSGYGRTESNLLVRIDVTYLRQDFSVMQNVIDWTAEAWTQKQRFDFFLRKRVLTPSEAAELLGRLSGDSPYHRAVIHTLKLLRERN